MCKLSVPDQQWLCIILVRRIKFSNLAAPLRVSRVAGDLFQRQTVTLHHCQSPFMTQTNIQQHSEAVAVHHLGVAYQYLARKTCDGGRAFKSRHPSESFKSSRGLIPTANCHVAPLQEPIHDPNQHTATLTSSGCTSSWCGV